MNKSTTYKPSPLGKIPSDWEVKKLKDILIEGKLGGNYENAEANNGIPVIKMGNLDRSVIKIDKIQYLPENEKFNNDDVLKEGDLLFNTRNTLDLVGKVAIWQNELPFAVYNSNLMRMQFDDKYVASNYFMNFAFNSHYGLSQLRGIATGTTSVAAIYGRDLEKIKFILPPLSEQRAIATCLSVWDDAITKTQTLITQKEARKKWLMQQLLTGKNRLKGYDKEWKEVQLKDCFHFVKSYSISRDGLSKDEGDLYCIHYGDIHAFYETEFLDFKKQNCIPRIIDEKTDIQEKDYLKDGDVIMADASEDYEGVGESVVVLNIDNKVAVGGLHTIILRDFAGETVSQYRGYLFASERVRNELRKKTFKLLIISYSKQYILI